MPDASFGEILSQENKVESDGAGCLMVPDIPRCKPLHMHVCIHRHMQKHTINSLAKVQSRFMSIFLYMGQFIRPALFPVLFVAAAAKLLV